MNKQEAIFSQAFNDAISPRQPWRWKDLYNPESLAALHQSFTDELQTLAPELHAQLSQYYQGVDLENKVHSELITRLAPQVGNFIAKLFDIEAAAERLRSDILRMQAVPRLRKEFVKKRKIVIVDDRDKGIHFLSELSKTALNVAARLQHHVPETEENNPELYFALGTVFWVEKADLARRARQGGGVQWTREDQAAVKALRETARLDADDDSLVLESVLKALEEDYARIADKSWASSWEPKKLDFENLVSLRRSNSDHPNGVSELEGESHHRRERAEPFALTDLRASAAQVAVQVDYCVICHEREKDSCRKGFATDHGYKKNALNVPLEGCPLDEHISEAHALRTRGEAIAALAVVMMDNPMCPGTGHRICNECMRACIFQTQDPVNIPEVETRILTDVLNLPWGFEIYSLLTRWNPLNAQRPYALPYNGKNVLVVGLGPAGYTLAHYLSNEGFGVLGIDGLKIEPLHHPEPIEWIDGIRSPLQNRLITGFGGVSEYGITNRWDKNFLDIIYLALLRRSNAAFLGGVRFGGTVTLDDAWALGFDHVALCTGAGRPTLVPMAHAMPRGMRMASDFLMNLQLSTPYRQGSIANLDVELPALVIGGGLTAVDTATELAAYYIAQAEKVFAASGADFADLDDEARRRLKILSEHGAQIAEERVEASREGRQPRLAKLIQEWGGVHIAYRKRLQDSPAYRLNYEEVEKAFQEGIQYIEHVSPIEAKVDLVGQIDAVLFETTTGQKLIPARTVCIAAGTAPNTSYEREYPGTFSVDPKGYFKTSDEDAFFTCYGLAAEKNAHRVSYFGDSHPAYAGSVVKAMASAKDGYRSIVKHLNNASPTTKSWHDFKQIIANQWTATVQSVQVLAPGIVEVIVKAPAAAQHFHPGQFYRLQNFASFWNHGSLHLRQPHQVMEPLAMTGAWVDAAKGLVSVIALEIGASSRLCRTLEVDEPVILMGPTGSPTEIPERQTVVLVGGGLGNAVLFSIAEALKRAQCRVIYFAGYRRAQDLFKRASIESFSDQVIWATDTSPGIEAQRPQDKSFVGNIVQSMVAYAEGKLGAHTISLAEVDRIIAIGSDRMMRAVKEARHSVLKPYLNPAHTAIGSINSPMQCMMKEICAQCLQRHVDPVTGRETFVYSCVNQDQLLDEVDFDFLSQRLNQNKVLEILTNRLRS